MKGTDPFYSTGAWKRLRQMALDRDHGFCVWCLRAGRYARDRHGRRVNVLATTVHHVKPRRDYPELEYELSNLVSLCDGCHDEAHPEKFGRKEKDAVPEIARGIAIARL